jgi:hypothetical protein
LRTDLKKSVIYKKLSTQKVTSDLNGRRMFAQILASQNSKGKKENMKILGFDRRKKEKLFFSKILNLFWFLF